MHNDPDDGNALWGCLISAALVVVVVGLAMLVRWLT
jgi:hypothetical protein